MEANMVNVEGQFFTFWSLSMCDSCKAYIFLSFAVQPPTSLPPHVFGCVSDSIRKTFEDTVIDSITTKKKDLCMIWNIGNLIATI